MKEEFEASQKLTKKHCTVGIVHNCDMKNATMIGGRDVARQHLGRFKQDWRDLKSWKAEKVENCGSMEVPCF